MTVGLCTKLCTGNHCHLVCSIGSKYFFEYSMLKIENKEEKETHLVISMSLTTDLMWVIHVYVVMLAYEI